MKETTSTGRKGEHLFRGHCVDQDVTCHKAYDDDYGWDFFIEFPPDNNQTGPIDMHPAQLCALVQVKTTSNYRSMSVPLKLSNALRMAKSPQPFFLVRIHARKGHEPRIFVRHVWKEFIADALKAGRLADNRRRLATHRQSVRIAFTDADDHTSDLLGFIKSEIEGAGPRYSAAKQDILDTIGFETGRGTIQMTVEIETDDDIFDLLLGRRESLNLTRLEQVSERFGIPAGKKEIIEERGKVYVKPPRSSGALRIRSGKGDERMIPAEVIYAHLPDQNGGRDRTRIVASCLEIIRGEGANGASANLSFEKSSLADIEMFGTLHQWGQDGPVELMLMMNGTRIGLGQLDLSTPTPGKGKWVRVGLAARLLRQLCAAAMAGDVPITLHDIVEASVDLEYLAVIASDRPVKLDFHPAPGCPAKFGLALGYMVVCVGNWTITVLAQRPVPHQKEVEGRRELFLGNASILDAYVETTVTATAPSQIEVQYTEALTRLDVNKDVFELGDIREFINASLNEPNQHHAVPEA